MGNRKHRSIRAVAVRNRKLPCRVDGCEAFRTSVGRLCRKHLAASDRHGSPLGRHIKPAEYEYESRLIDALFAEHREHAGLVEACAWIGRWMEQAANGEAVPGRREMRRLFDAQVSPLAILSAACSVFLFARWHERTLPSDARLTYAVGNAVLNLATHERRSMYVDGKVKLYSSPPSKASRRDVGERLREHLAPLLANAAEAVEAGVANKQRAAAALHLPFSTSSTSRQQERLAATTEESPPQESKP